MKLSISLTLMVLTALSITAIAAEQPLNAQSLGPDSPAPLLLTNDQEQYRLGPHLEILEDTEKQWTIADIASPEFASRFEPSTQEIPSKGFNDSVYWVRLRLRNQSDWAEWWLQHDRADIHYIDLNIPPADGTGFKTIQTGALMSFETRDVPALDYVFRLAIPPQSTQTLYLRYEHNRATDLPLQLWTPNAFVNSNQLDLWFWGMNFSLMILLMIIALILSYRLRSKTLLYAGIALLFLMMNHAVLHGFVQQYLVPDLGAWFLILESFTGGLILVAVLKFASSLLQTQQRYPNWHRVINGLIVLCLLVMLQIPFVDDRLVGQQLTIVWIASIAALFILSLQVGLRSTRRAQYFITGALIIIVLSVLTILIRAGLGASFGLAETQDTYPVLVIFITISLVAANRFANTWLKQESLAEDLRVTNEALERRIVDRTRELSALYDVTSVASQSLDRETAMALSLEQVASAMQGDAGAIHLADESGATLHLAINQGLPSSTVAQIETLPVGNGLPGWVMEHKETLVVTDMTTDPRSLPATAGQRTFQAYVGTPIQAGGSFVGVLSIVRKRGQPLFSVEEVALLGSIADQVGVVVESARLREQVEQVAVMEERARLARDLHDSVTQLLYSINLFADVGREAYRLGNHKQMDISLVELGGIARKALREMRLFVYELRPPILEQDGLALALKHRLERVEERANIETHLYLEDRIDLSDIQEEAFFHIAREALNNILKHTEATLVTVRVYTDGDLIEMEIIDNGQGFDPDQTAVNGGMGLVSMRERAEKLGGELTIFSTPGEGTHVQVKLNGRSPNG